MTDDIAKSKAKLAMNDSEAVIMYLIEIIKDEQNIQCKIIMKILLSSRLSKWKGRADLVCEISIRSDS